jgi:phage terminase small subunit
MGKLKNERQELFCQNVVKGFPYFKAYMKAGYETTEAAARSSSSDLLTNPNIENRIAELMKNAKTKAVMKKSELLEYMTKAQKLNTIDAVESVEDLRRYGEFIEQIEFDAGGNIKKVKFVSKAKQEELFARYYNMFTDTVKHEGEIKIKSEISMKDLDEALDKVD